MYKHRITRWNLKKNFKLKELEAVALTVGHFTKAGLKAPTANIDDREVPIERAKRHFPSLLKQTSRPFSSENFDSSAKDSLGSTLQTSRMEDRGSRWRKKSTLIPRVLLRQSSESHHLESTLVAVNNYYSWRLTQDDNFFTAQMHHTPGLSVASEPLHPYDVLHDVHYWVVLLGRGSHHAAQPLLLDMCTNLSTLLLQQHPSLLDGLLYWVWDDARAPNLFSNKLNTFIFALSRRLLGHDHPVSMIGRLMQNGETSMKQQQAVLQLMCDIVKRQKTSTSTEIFELEYNLIYISITYDDFETASEFCEKLLRRYEEEYWAESYFCRRILYMIAKLNHDWNELDTAEGILRQLIGPDDSSTQDHPRADETTVSAMELLGRLFENRGALPNAEEWLSRALKTACNMWVVDDPFVQHIAG